MTSQAELNELDELDREYYRSKLDELSWALPVVRAAQAYVRNEAASLDSEFLHRLVTAVTFYNENPKP